ncbi:MAG: hypothetical protein WC470_01085 [Candidatus Paceibacterota bacterium]
MKKFIFGLITGVVIFMLLNFFGIVDLKQFGKGFWSSSSIVAPENLIEGAQQFGSLKVAITSGQGAFIGNIEVDVGEHPGGKMAMEITDKNGIAFFDKMPVGNFVIFFNDNTLPKNFEKAPSLIPVKIIEGQTTEQNIQLSEIIKK